MDLVDSLEQTFRHAGGVIAGVRVDQYGDPTPCEAWTVRDLLQHVVGVVAELGDAAAGRAPDAPFELAPDPAAQFHEAAVGAIAAWRAPGVLDRVVDARPGPMPGRALVSINLLDTATHTWDLATATGQDADLPEDVALAALEASLATISLEMRPGRFGPELIPPVDAGTTARLVAFLGRKP